MGAWGDGIFQNDTAMDYLGDLSDAPDAGGATLRGSLEDAAGTPADEYLDSDVGSEALAAAAVVSAAAEGSPVDRSDPSVNEYLDKVTPHVPDGLAPLAVQAIDRVLAAESEIVELWEETDGLDAFRAQPLAVREHLAAR